MSSIIKAFSDVFTSILELFTSLIRSIFSGIQSIFAVLGTALNDVLKLFGGLIEFVLSKFPACSRATCAMDESANISIQET